MATLNALLDWLWMLVASLVLPPRVVEWRADD